MSRFLPILLALAFAAPAQAGQTPVLSVSGQTLTWTGKVKPYIVEAKPGGQVFVEATTYDPPTPGEYRVRPKASPKRWSNVVTIPPAEEKEEEPPPVNVAGEVKYRLNAKSAYDQYSGDHAFLSAHIDRILGYVPFADSRYLPYVPTVAYHDAYTKCGAGNLNPSCRATYVKEVERDVQAGYTGQSGQFMDDVEWSGSGEHIAGTDEEMAQLIEAVRRAMPDGVLELNTQWRDLWPRIQAGNPYVARALAVSDHIDKEFGVNGASGINTPAIFADYLRYVDALHALPVHLDQADSEPGNVYEVATYLLSNDGGDYIGSFFNGPSAWNTLYDTNLGAATGPREQIGTAYRRRFVGGTVYVNPPGAATTTIDGHTLAARSGLIV